MSAYLALRLLGLLPVLLGVSVLVFLLLHLIPGDAAQVLAGPLATPQDIERLRRELGLTQPLHMQLLLWLAHVAHGDLGRSISSGTPVLPYVLDKFKATTVLTAASLCMAVTVGVVTGVASATRRGGWVDRLTMLGALSGVSMPVFWLGIVLILVFSLRFRWLPATGMFSPGLERVEFVDLARHLVLPAATLAAASTAVITRMTRSSVLEVVGHDFVRTARAKGLSERVVVYKHTLKNALIPILSVIGVQVGYLLSGAILTETVFAWPGLGTLMVGAISTRDLPVVQGGVLLIATSFVLVNLAVDVAYGWIDPRIRYD